MNKTDAYWDISLTTHCPKCDEYIDMLYDSDLDIDPLEHETNRTTDMEVTCPSCGEEFLVTLWY